MMQLNKYIDGNPVKDDILIADLRNQSSERTKTIPAAFQFPILQIHGLSSTAIGQLQKDILKSLSNITPQQKRIVLICEDGGPRSKLIWELIRGHYDTYIYKSGFRGLNKWIRKISSTPFYPITLQGKTGSGKTELLPLLHDLGIQTIDLEGIANHAGSVFGSIRKGNQPSQFQFELQLAIVLDKLQTEMPVVFESEQINIGQVTIPFALWKRLEKAVHIYIDVDDEVRLNRLVDNYANHDDDKLIHGIQLLAAKLGDETSALVDQIRNKNYKTVAKRLMLYFDETPGYNTQKPHNDENFRVIGNDLKRAANEIAVYIKEKAPN